jgi:hypothetical protein
VVPVDFGALGGIGNILGMAAQPVLRNLRQWSAGDDLFNCARSWLWRGLRTFFDNGLVIVVIAIVAALLRDAFLCACTNFIALSLCCLRFLMQLGDLLVVILCDLEARVAISFSYAGDGTLLYFSGSSYFLWIPMRPWRHISA